LKSPQAPTLEQQPAALEGVVKTLIRDYEHILQSKKQSEADLMATIRQQREENAGLQNSLLETKL
jgi:hypothetical protein